MASFVERLNGLLKIPQKINDRVGNSALVFGAK